MSYVIIGGVRIKVKKGWNKRRLIMLCCFLLLFLFGCQSFQDLARKTGQNKKYEQAIFAMDTYMTFTAYGEKGEKAIEKAISEVERLEKLWSVGIEDSEVSVLNAKGKIESSTDTIELMNKALTIAKDTDYAFCITIYPLMELWGFTTGRYQVPDEKKIKETLKLVEEQKIKVDEKNKSIALGSGQKIDLGGIAKGFASSRIMEIWEKMDVKSGMVSLGGNVQVLGLKPDGTKWQIGVKDPNSTEGNILGVLSVKDCAVITSGSYERFFEKAGKRYHHILDPITGKPVENGLVSVTIIVKDGAIGDGLSTALFVMGKEKALSYWKEHRREFDAIFVTKDGEITITEGIKDCFQTKYNYKVEE